jgi:hypothetical protein
MRAGDGLKSNLSPKLTKLTGSELARGIAKTDDLALVAAVSRTRDLGEVLSERDLTCPIYSSATEALARVRCVSRTELVVLEGAESLGANVLDLLPFGLVSPDQGAHIVRAGLEN